MVLVVENLATSAGDVGLTPGLGRSPGIWDGIPLQYYCLENFMGRRVWQGYSPWGHKESDTTEQRSTQPTLTSQVYPWLWLVSQFSHSVVSDSLWPHEPQHARTPCPSPNLPKLMSIELVMPSNHIILCRPLLLLPSVFSNIRVFSNKPALCIRWPKYWSFNFTISPSNEHLGPISLRMDWLDLLAVQGTLKSLLQHHSSKASLFQRSAFQMSSSDIHTWLLEKP